MLPSHHIARHDGAVYHPDSHRALRRECVFFVVAFGSSTQAFWRWQRNQSGASEVLYLNHLLTHGPMGFLCYSIWCGIRSWCFAVGSCFTMPPAHASALARRFSQLWHASVWNSKLTCQGEGGNTHCWAWWYWSGCGSCCGCWWCGCWWCGWGWRQITAQNSWSSTWGKYMSVPKWRICMLTKSWRSHPISRRVCCSVMVMSCCLHQDQTSWASFHAGGGLMGPLAPTKVRKERAHHGR